MFIFNIIPLSIQKSFSDYASFLIDKWIVRPHHQFIPTEVHLLFDHPNRKGMSPKDLEMSRRDVNAQVFEYDHISPDSILPSNWGTFLSDQARCAFGNSSAEYIVAAGDHEESDTRMWLHAVTSTAQTVCINSPNTDVYFIGLSILKNTNLQEMSVYVQLKDSPYEKICY